MANEVTIDRIVTKPEKVGERGSGSLLIKGGVPLRTALEEASVHLCSVISIARGAAMEPTGSVSLHGAVTLAEIAKALVDAAAVAAMLATRDEVTNG
ncbi:MULTISPECIES: DUF3077 domain-containing protein [Burkholderia cepacia complex]|uniref:Uncharacterized protein n=1 Tax=Burkholderia multivorans CGD2 TaxID=513052 RepID=B9BQI1_9BURK|nr:MULTISPECIES: DUF3077 domain-containing protein [Burkholderia cepacia complex]EEE06876.1 hypothetical protein BURMUCGD2_1188 [Burkholderia multivorans CGD2]EEE13180.1 hypothetical protein BURMUCGD2M_1279 [Burkholderia multivorans CGD2M]MBY4752023.1 DUF3077 domain-containing protein [Burkholderia dolosa]